MSTTDSGVNGLSFLCQWILDARTVHIQVDQYLARAWLWHIEHLDLGGDFARVIVDASFVLLG